MSHGARLRLGRQGARRGWRAAINRTRRDIRDLLKDSPSLRLLVAAMVADQAQRARKELADWLIEHDESSQVDIAGLTFTDPSLRYIGTR